MSILSPSVALFSGFCLLGALPAGCKRDPAPAPSQGAGAARPVTSPGSSATLPLTPEQASHCRRLTGFGLTVEAAGAAVDAAGTAPKNAAVAAPEADESDDDALLPFGVDLGSALSTPQGFAVAGIRGAGQAFVALLGERASSRVELGELHGDVEPPALAASGEQVIVALRSSDAAGFTLKLGQIAAQGSGVEWGYELSKLGKGVSSLDVAISGAQGAVVFQDEQKGSSRVWLGAFSPGDLKAAVHAKAFDAKDVEGPRLAPRPGGYWLSWVRSLPEPKKAPKKPTEGQPAEDPEERDLLELGLRALEVLKLDDQGKPQGEALRVGEPRRQVILFDVTPLASGGLLIAARSDSAAPGAEGGALLLSEVGLDGSVREERLDDDEIGAGAPALLLDAGAQPLQGGVQPPKPWLAVASPSDATRIGVARGAATQLLGDPALARVEVIAVGAGHFLTARSRRQGVELAALDCQLQAATPAEK